ncbi:MAG: dTMP kinase [Fusobacteria bacterium]|nr:MAG: dTMP kinase [Fusobacteriota bacterium]KAF0228784.1 MAG: dTMP [Fusobacteriota bacterium]
MFITFEGIDGSGKSTQCQLLKDSLEKKGYKVLVTREPGGTKTAEAIRNVLLHIHEPIEAMTEVFLYCAARVEHLEKIILPKLAEGYIVISDRFYDSTIAYQGGGRGLGLEKMIEINKVFIEKATPDLTFFIDTNLMTIEKRMDKKELDRMEKEGMAFMKKVRQGYLDLIASEEAKVKKSRFTIVDGDLSIGALADMVLMRIEEVLEHDRG